MSVVSDMNDGQQQNMALKSPAVMLSTFGPKLLGQSLDP